MNTFSSVSVQALSPGFKVNGDDIESMKEVLQFFDFEEFESRTIIYILETYWLIRAQNLA